MTSPRYFRISNSFIFCIPLCFALLIPAYAHGEESDDGSSYVVQGNLLYRNGEFSQAARSYARAISVGTDNAHVHYNLGNAFYRLKEYGNAILNYRRALRQMPRHPDVLANLQLARRQTQDKLPFENLVSWNAASQLLSIPSQLSRYQRSIFFIVCYIAFWLCFCLMPITRHRSIRLMQMAALVLTLLGSVVLFGTRESREGTLVFAFDEKERQMAPAVITSPEAKVFSGDSTQFQVIFLLHDGAEVEIGRVRDSWIEIILPKKRRGWIQKKDLEIV